MRLLQELDVIESLFENDESVGLADFPYHLFPGVIGVGGANYHLQGRVRFPDAVNGFHAVPAWRHAHIDESQRVGPALLNGPLHLLQTFLALVGRIDLEAGLVGLLRGVAEKQGFGADKSLVFRSVPNADPADFMLARGM